MPTALRSLARSPQFSVIALLIVAICLGANLTIFSVLDGVLLRPLPFPDADRLVTVYNTYPHAGVDRDGASYTNYYERRGQLAALDSLALVQFGNALAGDSGATEDLALARVTPDFFSTLGVAPRLGRAFAEAETAPRADGVVILTDAYWRERLHADPAVLTRTLRLNGEPRQIVGVLPPDFRFLSAEARLYVPLVSDAARRGPAGRHSGNALSMIGRLAPGASLAEAQTQIDAHNASVADSYPKAKMIADAGFRSVVASLHGDHVRGIRPVLLLLQGGVLLLLLIGVVNLINLLLIRASARARESAVRQTLGATRGHVIRAVLAETMLLAVGGGLGGLLVAAFGLDLVRVLGAARLPLGAHLALDGRTLAAALLGTVLVGLVSALPVIWFNLRAPLSPALSGSRTSTASPAAQRLRHAFIVTQLALAFVLLSGASLLGLSLERAMAVSPGFSPDHLLSGQITLPGKNYGGGAYLPFTEKLLAEFAAQPGVAAVGLATKLPVSGPTTTSAITVQGHVVAPGGSVRTHHTYGVSGDYFAALGLPLRSGRFLDASDSRRTGRVCVVDDDFARRYWPDGGALGQHLFQGSNHLTDAHAFTVVGVVGTVKQTDLTETSALGTVYFPLVHRSDLRLFVVARASLPPETLGAALQSALRRLDPELPLTDLRPMEQRLADTLVARRTPALLAGLFAGVALLLAAIGTYGVLSYAVAQRTREIGVRLALGAPAARIGRQFLALGLRLLAAGTGLGLAGAWLTGRALQTILFDVPTLHLATLAITTAVLTALALLACWLPARRATRIDPIVALRNE